MHALGFTLCVGAGALLVEALISYPQRLYQRIGHPVTWMGACIAFLDTHLNRETARPLQRRLGGLLALLLLLLAIGIPAETAASILARVPFALGLGLSALLASTTLAQRSLHAHVAAVGEALRDGGQDAARIALARTAVARIVGRDVSLLDEAGIARAAIESLAENFSDGIVAPAFWLALLGLPGGFLYKAVNTADSMIGHRTERHRVFGWAAARFDDLVNLIPARLAALWLCLAAFLLPEASGKDAWRMAWRDAAGHPSPNAGWPEAAMAGALALRLGGPRFYGGRKVEDGWIGEGGDADTAALFQALRLYRAACFLQGTVLIAGATACVLTL